MDYRDEVFLAVARYLNFSKAAAELHISQPAVSKHIKNLESRLQCSLFERHGNTIHLSTEGLILQKRLKHIRSLYHDATFEISRSQLKFQGRLHIGASSTIAQYWLPPVIAAFHRCYPDIKLALRNGNSDQMERDLLAHDIDIALVENRRHHADIRYIDFLKDNIVPVTSAQSPLAQKKNISLEQLRQIPIILREKGSGTLQIIEKKLHSLGINLDELNVTLQMGSTEAIKNFLCEFDGLALLSEKSLEKDISLERLVKIDIEKLSISRQFRSALRQGQEHKLARLFENFLISHN